MKIASVSADLLIKLALAGVAVGVVVFVVYKLKNGLASAGQAVGNAAWAVNPLNNDNVIYNTAGQAWGAVTGQPADRPLGTRIYNFFHPEEEL